MLSAIVTFRSFVYLNGVNTVMVDGSVRFVRDSVDPLSLVIFECQKRRTDREFGPKKLNVLDLLEIVIA